MITISVITCTYNAESTLRRTLESVERQSYRYVEHLIVDGCSTDGTVAMAEDYRLRNVQSDGMHEVKVVSEPDNGLYDAMNKALAMAGGEYVVFLNSGDTFSSPDTLDLVAGAVGESEALPGVLYGETDIVDDEGQFVRHRRLSAPPSLNWRSFRKGMLVCHQSFYALRSVAIGCPYNLGYRYSADVDWCIRVMKKCEREGLMLRRVDAVLTNYLQGGMSVKNHRKSLVERFRVMTRHYGLLTTLWMHFIFAVRAVTKR